MVRLFLVQRLRGDLLGHRFTATVLATALLMGAGAALGTADLARRQQVYARTLSRQPDLAGVLRSPALLGVVAGGVATDVYGGKAVAGINLERVPPPSYERPLLALFPVPDLLFLVQYVLSLFALLLAFDVVAGLKERGLLRVMLAGPVSRASLLAGQCLGGYLSVACAFAVGLLTASAVVLGSGVGAIGGEHALRLAAIAGVCLLYLAVAFMLGVVVSSFSRTSSQALVASLMLWVTLVLVVPHALMLLAGQWYRIRPPEVVAAEKNAARSAILSAPGAFATEWPRANQAMEALDESYAREVSRQQALSRALTRLSPVGSLVFGVTALTGTSIQDAENHVSGVRSFLSRLRAYVYVERRQQPGAKPPVPLLHGLAWSDSLALGARDAALLAGWLVLLSGVAFRRFAHYDVR